MQTNYQHPDPLLHWKHRRRHSYISLSTLVVLTFGLLAAEVFRPGTVAGVGPMIGPAYTAFCLVILAYIANCAVEAWIDRR